jgi:hypothetical protein
MAEDPEGTIVGLNRRSRTVILVWRGIRIVKRGWLVLLRVALAVLWGVGVASAPWRGYDAALNWDDVGQGGVT